MITLDFVSGNRLNIVIHESGAKFTLVDVVPHFMTHVHYYIGHTHTECLDQFLWDSCYIQMCVFNCALPEVVDSEMRENRRI